MNKASEIVRSLTPTWGESAARNLAQSAIDAGQAENDLGPAPSMDDSLVSQVLQSLTNAKVLVPAATAAVSTQVQVSQSAVAAETDDLEVAMASLAGKVDGLVKIIDAVVVQLNQSTTIQAQALELMFKGVKAVDQRVIEGNTQVVELKQSIATRQAPRAATGRVAAEPNLQDQAAQQVLSQGQEEIEARMRLQTQISVEIAQSAALERQTPGSQKARFEQLQAASMTLLRPVPAKTIAQTYNITIPS